MSRMIVVSDSRTNEIHTPVSWLSHVVSRGVVEVVMSQETSTPGRLLLSRFHTETSMTDGQSPFHRTKIVENTETLRAYVHGNESMS